MKKTLTRNSVALFLSVLFTAQMYFGGIVLPGLFADYPEINTNVIMLFYTLPLLVNGVLGIALGAVIAKANKRMLVILGQACIVLGGLLIVLTGARSFPAALTGSILCGVGAAFTQNAASVLLSQENPEKTSVLVSMNTAIQGMGSMICTTVGGVLAEAHWTRMYITTFPAAVTMLLFILLFHSTAAVTADLSDNGEESAESTGKDGTGRHMGIFILTVLIFFFAMMNQAAFLPNYSIYVITEKAIGTTAQAGLINTFGSFGSMISGLFLVAILLPRLKNLSVPIGLTLLLLPNLSIVLGTNSWVVIAVLFFSAMIGFPLIFGPLVGAGSKAFGPAAITTLTAMMGLVNFLGPYIINFIVGATSPVANKAIVGIICAVIGIIIAVPTMKKAETI